MNLLPVLCLNLSYENFKEAAKDQDYHCGMDDEIELMMTQQMRLPESYG
jgi:hypothetical protein